MPIDVDRAASVNDYMSTEYISEGRVGLRDALNLKMLYGWLFELEGELQRCSASKTTLRLVF